MLAVRRGGGGTRAGYPVSLSPVMGSALDRAVSTLIRDCLDLSPSEEVLVICNPITEELGALLRINAQGEGGEATLAVISERESHAAEPPRAVAAAMLAADIVVAPTIQSISHTEARRKATEAGVRVASMPGVTGEMLDDVIDRQHHRHVVLLNLPGLGEFALVHVPDHRRRSARRRRSECRGRRAPAPSGCHRRSRNCRRR